MFLAKAGLSGSLKLNLTLHRAFLKPVINSWDVLGTEPNAEVKRNLTASRKASEP